MPGEIGQQCAPQYSTGKVHHGATSLMLVLKQAVGQAAVPSVPLSTQIAFIKGCVTLWSLWFHIVV